MNKQWYEEAVFYELYIRAFGDSNGDGHGDFRGAIAKLDHIQSLGVNCIWIMPMYPSPLKDDGYDIADYTNIHPDYGTLDDFRAFLEAAHARGLRVVTDLVLNHTSDQHPWFQAARQDKNSPYRDYYVWSDSGTAYAQTPIVFLDVEPSNWTYDEVAGQYFWHRFYRSQPDLNYDCPAVHEEMLRVMRFWLDMGVDGFRADAVPYLYEREGTMCENLPETHAFLKKIRRLLDEEYPGRVLIAEANQWPEQLLPYFGNSDEFHMCFHFPMMPRFYLALAQGDKTPLVEILRRTPALPAGAQWLTFLRNHDELTLEMVSETELQAMWAYYAPEPRMRLNRGIRRRLAPLLGDDTRRWFLLHALFLSLPGAPIVYYGDEIGMGDNIWLPDRHGCRTPMQWDDSTNAGFSRAVNTYLPVNEDFRRVNVAVQEADPQSPLNQTRFLLRTRQGQAALRGGELELVETGSTAVLAFKRVSPEQTVWGVFNLTAHTQAALPALAGLPSRNLLAGERPFVPTAPLEPYAAFWLV